MSEQHRQLSTRPASVLCHIIDSKRTTMNIAIPEATPERAPEPGELVQVRSRRWLVEETTSPGTPGESARVALACADDDNQGETLTVSSIEAFARSLAVHRQTVERHWHRDQDIAEPAKQPEISKAFSETLNADDERAEWSDKELEAEETEQIDALTAAGPDPITDDDAHAALWAREQALFDRMQEIADKTRHLPDAKTRRLIDWIRENLYPDLPPFEEPAEGTVPQWNNRRVLIFAENRQGTKRYLNRFHNPNESDAEIAQLRDLHAAMDRAVLDVYGWQDIATDCEFLLDYPIDEAEWGNRKKPYRYRWPDDVRDEVLARLLELNAERAAQERDDQLSDDIS